MDFKMPTKSNLKSRTSTISNAFTISITPYIKPTENEIQRQLEILGIQKNQCCYCLRNSNSTDHFKPLVESGIPSGYISDINNLVPCCSSCNSSKGKQNWETWFLSEKNVNMLTSLGFTNQAILERHEHLKKFDTITKQKLNYQEIVGVDKWNEFISRKNKLNDILKEDQKFCDELNTTILKYLKNHKN